MGNNAVREWHALGSGLTHAASTKARRRLAEQAIDPPPCGVRGVGDRSCRFAHHAQQLFAIAQIETISHAGLILSAQCVVRTPPVGQQDVVQGVAYIEQAFMGLIEPVSRDIGDPRSRHRPKHRRVPQPAVGLFQVRLQPVSQLPLGSSTFDGGIPQLIESRARPRAPKRQARRSRPVTKFAIPSQDSEIEQAQDHAEVLCRHSSGLTHGPQTVIDTSAGVPDGIPQTLPHFFDARVVRIEMVR